MATTSEREPLNPETGTTTQGETIEEALVNLREATQLYLEEFPQKVTGRALLTTFQVPMNAYGASLTYSIE